MMKAIKTLALAVCLMSPAVGLHAADGLENEVAPQVRETIEETIGELKSVPRYVWKNPARQAAALKALAELGKLGPDAAPAVPFLLSEEFFLIRGGYTSRDNPLRLATIDTLVQRPPRREQVAGKGRWTGRAVQPIPRHVLPIPRHVLPRTPRLYA